MELTAGIVIVPLAFASLVTGLVQSFGTSWGLVRHYWVLAKLALTVIATIVLLLKMKLIGKLASMTAATLFSEADVRAMRIELLVHAAGGLLVLLAITTVSVVKPWGMTAYGRRQIPQADAPPPRPARNVTVVRDPVFAISSRRWGQIITVHAIHASNLAG